MDPSVPAYWTNRSFAHIKLENYGYAISDAEEAIKLDASFIKAYYRRASANMALGKFKESLKDFRTVVKYVPQDADARAKLAEVEKIVRKAEFEKALASDDSKPVEEKLRINEIVVEDSYDGQRWEDDGPVTLEFVNDMINRFENQKTIHRKYAYKLMSACKKIFEALPTVVDITVPRVPGGKLTICGDTHGQYYDLLNIFKINGRPSESHAYLFNGDFVDRGSFSAEVVFTLLGFKALYPNTFFMARGNHETIDMNKVYGFTGEIKAKYTELMFDFFTEIFNVIPLGNVIEKRVFVTHGGLFSRDDVTLDELRKLDRNGQPRSGLQCEMLWSDPMELMGRAPSKRGIGVQFGPDVTEAFLKLNNLDMLVRSHEVKDEGYVIEHNGKCVTVFSAPNYCDTIGNKGAFINISLKNPQDTSDRPELVYDYQKFTAAPHPPVKAMQYAGFMNSFL